MEGMMTEVIRTRISPEFKRAIENYADQYDVEVSDFLRYAAYKTMQILGKNKSGEEKNAIREEITLTNCEALSGIIRPLSPNIQETKMITISELSETIGLSVSYLTKHCADRSLPHYKIGRRILFDRVEIIKHLHKTARREAI